MPHFSQLLTESDICSLYHKHNTIENDNASVISDTPNCNITYDRNWWHKLKLRLMLALRLNKFIIQVSIAIITYDRKNIFIILATGGKTCLLNTSCAMMPLLIFNSQHLSVRPSRLVTDMSVIPNFLHTIFDCKFYTRCQFHQHFMSSFCAKILSPKNYKPKL